MKIISFDVGIKNLAFAYLNSEENGEKISIIKWGILDLSCPENYKCCIDNCNNKVLYLKNTEKTQNDDCKKYYCKKHSKDLKIKVIPVELKERNIKNKKIDYLKQINDKYKISEKFTIKKDFLSNLNHFVSINYLLDIPKENANNIDLIQLGIRLKKQMNEEFLKEISIGKTTLDIEKVYIENQISPIANRMKTLQGMLSQYFIMNDVNNIKFCSSINKLKDVTTKKLNYKERKQLGIDTTLNILKTNIINGVDYVNYFNINKKKDDLADSLLQALFYLKN